MPRGDLPLLRWPRIRTRAAHGALACVVWAAICAGPALGRDAEGDDALQRALAAVSGSAIEEHVRSLEALPPPEGPGPAASSARATWIATKLQQAGLTPRGTSGAWLLPAGSPAHSPADSSAPHVLGSIESSGAAVAEESLLICADMRRPAAAAVLAHLAQVLAQASLPPHRRIVFCGLAGDDGASGAALAAHLGQAGSVVTALIVGEVNAKGPRRVDGVRAYAGMHARLGACLDAEQRKALRFVRAGVGAAEELRERGVPAFRVSGGPAQPLARLIATLLVKLSTHPQPLADPYGIAGYIERSVPRFGFDDLVQKTPGNFELARASRHALWLGSGFALLVVNVPEDIEAGVGWRALEAIAARRGAVDYRMARRVADIERAYADGAVAVMPRLCCARSAHEDPTCFATAAALGYRWLAPWSTGTQRTPDFHLVKPLVAAARKLRVILDAGDLPPPRHKALRAALGDTPVLFVNRSDVRGPELGPRTLPMVRFRGRETWEQALAFFPGMAAPIVHKPRGEVLAKAIAAWGAKQPAGWDAPGSPQRKALRAALGGRLLEWLAYVER